MLTRDRVQEALDDAVDRGRMTRSDATDARCRAVRARARADRRPARRARGGRGRYADAHRARGRPRPPRDRHRLEVPDLRLRRPDARRRSATASATCPRRELRKVRDYERRNANRKSVLRSDRAQARASLPCWERDVRSHGTTSVTPPPRGDELELTVDSLAYGGNGVARLRTATSSSSRGAIPGDRVRAVVTQVQARLRRGAHRRGARALARPHRRRSPTTPARRGRCCPTSASSRSRQQQVDDALRRIGRLDGFELEPIVPAVEQWRYRNKLEYSFGTGADGRARLRLPRARPLGRRSSRSTTACSPPSAATRAREQVLAVVPRAGPRRLGPPHAARASCATSSCARAGAPASCRCASSRRPASSTPTRSQRRGRLRRPALDPDRRRSARRTAGRRDRAALRQRRSSRRSSAACASAISPEAFFQTNTEMAERLYGVAAEYAGAAGLRARLRPLLRHRHDRPDAAPRAAREVSGVEIVEAAVADAIENARAQRDHQRAASSPATSASRCASSSSAPGAPDVVVVDPPRAGLSQKVVRRIIEAAPRADRLRLLQPDDARAERRAARRGRLRRCARVRPVDMFPQTPHIECVALLERS